MDENDLEPVWGLVANVVDGRFYGPEPVIRSGTKHFVPGAKVFYHGAYWGMGADQVRVTGRHRGSKRLVTMVIARHHLHNWRAQLIYKPAVLKRLNASWYELAPSARVVDPEAAARERADNFNNALHFSAYDRPKEEVHELIESWQRDGHDDLDRIRDFNADRWIILYEQLTPVGVGVSNFAREHESWIKPEFERHRTPLESRLERSVPEGTDSPKLEYETGLSTETLQQLSELMSVHFDDLHDAAFEAGQLDPDVDILARFVSPLLRSSLMDWPQALSGFEDEILAGWLDGRAEAVVADEIGVSQMQVVAGFERLYTTGYQLTGAAFRLMKKEREYDSDESESISRVLGRDRLQRGVNSHLAFGLVRYLFHEPFGVVRFHRVAASSLATEFEDQNARREQGSFTQFALGRAKDWITAGLIQPIDPSGDERSWGLRRNQADQPSVAYHIGDSAGVNGPLGLVLHVRWSKERGRPTG